MDKTSILYSEFSDFFNSTKNTTVVKNEIMKKNTNKHLSKKATTRFHVNFSLIFTFTVSSEE
jgi:hypothetical protein